MPMAEWTLEAARAVLRDKFAPWIQDLGLSIESVGDGHAVLRLPSDPRLARDGGIVCGQALMAVADTGMVFALASRLGGFVEMATVGQTISFFRAAPGGEDVICDVRVLRLGRSLAFGEAVISAASRLEEPLAQASLTYAVAAPR